MSKAMSPILSRVVSQFQRFYRLESIGGILLLCSAVTALVWANSPLGSSYDSLWHTRVSASVGIYSFSTSLSHIVNDGLMAIFFFVVGLEIKRELIVGELSQRQKAMLPLIAALGGMIVPAFFFWMLNSGGPGVRGWGIPMATDIAFAIGVLVLIGRSIPAGLKVFLTAFAIVDDLGAVLVIALFYTAEMSWPLLGFGAVLLLILVLLNVANVRSLFAYVSVGILLWIAFLYSGVHATVAGVLLAMMIPARPILSARSFVQRGYILLKELEKGVGDAELPLTGRRAAVVQEMEDACDRVESPLHQFEHGLQPLVTFVIMPLFALANAGLVLAGPLPFNQPIAVGIMVGLVLGKPIGIALSSFIAVRFRLAALPAGTGWRHMIGAGVLGGIGFTMSLFIAALAFPGTQELEQAKVGVLMSSLIAGVAGWLYLRSVGFERRSSGA